MKNKIVVVGSYNVDITIKSARLPKNGETVLGNSISFSNGGKGANQAVAAVRAGAEVSFIAKVGNDSYGEKAISDLHKEGINTSGITVDQDFHTGMASITVDSNGENCIVAVPGANSRLTPEDIEESNSVIASADFLLIQLETPLETVESAINLAYKNNTSVILDPAPARKLSPEILGKVTVITPNKGEAELLTGIKITNESTMVKASKQLLSNGIKVVIITLGESGVYLSTQEYNKLIPACVVDALDSTGAGDVFNGVLAAHFNTDALLMVEAVSRAVATASLSVTRLGAQTAIPYLKDVEVFRKMHTNRQKTFIS